MTAQKIVSVCIVGGGFGKRVLFPVCEQHPRLQVTSVVVNRNIPADIQKSVPVFTDFETALQESESDLVVIASPHNIHEQQVRVALEAGKHVLCEKPLALHHGAAFALSAKCTDLGLIGAVDYSFRFIPARAYLADLVHAGEIGAMKIANLSFFRNDFSSWPSRWYYDRQQGGGMLSLTGSHLIDSARLLLASPIVQLSARIFESDGIDTGFAITMEAGDGAVCNIAVSHQIPGHGKHMLEVHGTEGSLCLREDGLIVKVVNGELFPQPIPESYFIGFGGQKWNGNPRLQPTACVIDVVVSAILTSTPLKALSFTVAAENQKLLDAAWESHRTRRGVSINEYK